MKTLKRFLLLSLIAGVTFLASCEKDDEVDKMSYEEGKQALENMDAQMASDLDAMTNSEGMAAIATLQGMPDPFASATKRNKETQVVSNIRSFLLPGIDKERLKSTEGASFDFSGHTGTYTWIDSLQRWEIIPGDPSDKIIINFPADSTNMDNNNATLTLHEYQEDTIPGDFIDDYYPTRILADLTIDGTKYMGLDVTAVWNEYGEPVDFGVSVFLKPFTFTASMTNEETAASIDLSIDYDGDEIFSTGMNATFMTDSMQNPKVIEGYLQYRTVRIDALVNAENITAMIEEMQSGQTSYTDQEIFDQINSEIDAYISSDGEKIADIKVGTVTNPETSQQEIGVLLVFGDGTEENAQPYFDNFSQKLEAFFNNIGIQLEDTYNIQ